MAKSNKHYAPFLTGRSRNESDRTIYYNVSEYQQTFLLTCFVFPIGHFHDDDIIDYNYQTTNDVEFYFNRFVLNDITKTKNNNTPKL